MASPAAPSSAPAPRILMEATRIFSSALSLPPFAVSSHSPEWSRPLLSREPCRCRALYTTGLYS